MRRLNQAVKAAVFSAGLGILVLAGSVQLQAGALHWEQPVISQDVLPTDKKTEAVFHFTNTSSAAVEIRSVKTSCGCTTAELARKTFGPGETGSLKAVFNFGGRKGRQKKTILVQAGDKGVPPDVLALRVHIPEPFVFDRETLVWPAGSAPAEQMIEVVVVDPSQAQIKAVRALGKNFTVNLEETEQSKRYLVKVTPLNTAEPVKGAIRLDVADPNPRAIYLPVAVKK